MKAHIYYATEAMWDRHGQYAMLTKAHEGNVVKSDITGDAASYRMVREFEVEDINSVFVAMQGENWSPNGEARFLIKSLGLCHTSMSVGDAVHFPETDRLYLCDRCGWVEIQ